MEGRLGSRSLLLAGGGLGPVVEARTARLGLVRVIAGVRSLFLPYERMGSGGPAGNHTLCLRSGDMQVERRGARCKRAFDVRKRLFPCSGGQGGAGVNPAVPTCEKPQVAGRSWEVENGLSAFSWGPDRDRPGQIVGA